MTQHVTELALNPADNERLANLSGPLDAHIRHVERRLGVSINARGNHYRIAGERRPVRAAGRLLKQLYRYTDQEVLTAEKVNICLQDSSLDLLVSEDAGDQEFVIRAGRCIIRPRGANQTNYLRQVQRHDINFGIGPAGTGKTYLAVACAVEALQTERVQRLVLARPAVEAGERLGFLPGDLSQKVDPYLRPLYDALYEMLGFERVPKLIERNVIEVAPLAFMRGRTLNDAFVILDEAQNTTVEQMKMFLTRIGFASTAVVTGDITQVDLPRTQRSGLRHAMEVLRDVDGISFSHFTARDVVRHSLVQKIITAYEAQEAEDGPI